MNQFRDRCRNVITTDLCVQLRWADADCASTSLVIERDGRKMIQSSSVRDSATSARFFTAI
jgi:hypothetical protein